MNLAQSGGHCGRMWDEEYTYTNTHTHTQSSLCEGPPAGFPNMSSMRRRIPPGWAKRQRHYTFGRGKTGQNGRNNRPTVGLMKNKWRNVNATVYRDTDRDCQLVVLDSRSLSRFSLCDPLTLMCRHFLSLLNMVIGVSGFLTEKCLCLFFCFLFFPLA